MQCLLFVFFPFYIFYTDATHLEASLNIEELKNINYAVDIVKKPVVLDEVSITLALIQDYALDHSLQWG